MLSLTKKDWRKGKNINYAIAILVAVSVIMVLFYSQYAVAQQHGKLFLNWKLQEKVAKQLALHRGTWLGMTSCDHNKCKIDYLGPISSNPYDHGISTLSDKNSELIDSGHDTPKFALDHNRMKP